MIEHYAVLVDMRYISLVSLSRYNSFDMRNMEKEIYRFMEL